ncbi:MAG TPA: ribosome maturation factor RimM [Actinomycetota bacterium]
MDEPTFVVGVVTKAHGVRGEVALRNRSDVPDRWVPGAVVHTREGRPLTVAAVRPHGERLLVTFEEVADRTTAEALRGVELVVPRSSRPPLGPDEWWPDELEGCRVVTEAGRDLGVVAEVVFNPANDLWVTVDQAGTETLVPALKDLLVDVDTDAKRIVVKDVPGLTTPEDDA